MKTMTIVVGGEVFRWAGGSFVAVWASDRADEHVPDDMIKLPGSLNKSRTGREDIARLAATWSRSA
jgi:hypothetical protein